jgi:hypothetical protein
MGLGSEILDLGKNLVRIPDPEVKKATDPGSGFATQLISGSYLLLIHLIIALLIG